ncbi:hypothetical protein BD289DRAFT_484676 [Coniella lustricola]|uniref:Uncharacterized protein n=1 Tax=Coniella lustricola TaxID=2025994 RepID=A0A2T3A156_9PEZI|nr:hypothetical protein BD289DRAFT_484676 [Coniella lustricola]
MAPTAITASGHLTRTKTAQLAANSHQSKSQASILVSTPTGKNAGKSTTKSNQIIKDAAGSIKLKHVIVGGETLPGDASDLVLLRCRQIQRFAHSKISSPFKNLITADLLAIANFAQPHWSQKLSEDELDWVPSWIYNARALRGVLSSKSFRALPLPKELHAGHDADQDAEPFPSVGNPPQATLNEPLEIEDADNEQEAETSPSHVRGPVLEDDAAKAGQDVGLFSQCEVAHSQARGQQTAVSEQQNAHLEAPPSVVRELIPQADLHVNEELEPQPAADHGFDHQRGNHSSASSVPPEFREVQHQQDLVQLENQATKPTVISNDSVSPSLYVKPIPQAHIANVSSTNPPRQPGNPSNTVAPETRRQRDAKSQVASQVESWINSIPDVTHDLESPAIPSTSAVPTTTFVSNHPSDLVSKEAGKTTPMRSGGEAIALQTVRSPVTAPKKVTFARIDTPDPSIRSPEKTEETQIPFVRLRAAILAFLNPTSELSGDECADTQGLGGVVGHGRDAAIRAAVIEVLEMSIAYAFNEGRPCAMELTEHIRTVQSLFLKFFESCTAANKGKSTLQEVYLLATDLNQAVICLEHVVNNSYQKYDNKDQPHQKDVNVHDVNEPSPGLSSLNAYLADDQKARELANSKEKMEILGSFQERKAYTQESRMVFRAWMAQNATRKLNSREDRKRESR